VPFCSKFSLFPLCRFFAAFCESVRGKRKKQINYVQFNGALTPTFPLRIPRSAFSHFLIPPSAFRIFLKGSAASVLERSFSGKGIFEIAPLANSVGPHLRISAMMLRRRRLHRCARADPQPAGRRVPFWRTPKVFSRPRPWGAKKAISERGLGSFFHRNLMQDVVETDLLGSMLKEHAADPEFVSRAIQVYDRGFRPF
jgi:hypothetical protein